MKNALNYYYGLDVSNIHQNNKEYSFAYQNRTYIFMACDNKIINDTYDLANSLNQNNISCHKIIPNKFGGLLTSLNDENYVLMQVFVDKRIICIDDIINFNNIKYANVYPKISDLYVLWTEKIDYLEYQMSQLGKKYPLLRESFGYYIGLAENAIAIIKGIDVSKAYISLSHRRINMKDTLWDLYNPLNIIFDIRVRDVCEYFKNSFFNGKNIENELFTFLFNNYLNYDESCYFLGRMLFPTYYFDLYEKIMDGQIDEEQIKKILTSVDEYQNVIKKVYLYFKNNINIPTIEWIIN